MPGTVDYSRFMRLPVLRWLVLLFTCAWFGVLVPVHNRGAIQLPGSGGHACCTKPAEAVADASVPACHRKAAAKPHCPTDQPSKGSGNCAVCYFVAGLDLPVPVMLDVPPLGLAEPIATFDLPTPADREHVRTRCERGPPLA
jgi:hypothetical protein